MKGTISANLALVLEDSSSRQQLKKLLTSGMDGKIAAQGKTYVIKVKTAYGTTVSLEHPPTGRHKAR